MASRNAPANVPPVTVDGIQYAIPHFGVDVGQEQNGGYVEATSNKTGARLWLVRVYEIKYDPNLETDVQDIFITALSIADGKLKIKNEAGDNFVVESRTGKVLEGTCRVYPRKKK